MRHVIFSLMVVLSAGFALAADDGWQDKFDVPKSNFVSTGKNDFCILTPGYVQTFEGVEDGKKGKLIITVTDQTEIVDGVETRVVEEREWSEGQLSEVSRNFFAVDRATNDIYYFGEAVDTYKDGKIAGHEGGWRSGKNGAHFGLFMPAKPVVGQKFYQEVAPGDAMDRAAVVSMSEKVTVPAGTFENCLKIEETSPLEPDSKEQKLYASGVGLLVDGGLKLVKYSQGTK
jgi:hypothetical protein